MIFPWHLRLIERLDGIIETGRLPNAMLLAQPPGWGIADLAAEVAARLIPGLPHDVEALQQVAHPDFRLVRREGRAQILVDQIRAANEFVFGTAQHGRKVVLLLGAEHLNLSAANALLKSLEEPPDGNVLLLVSERSERLLPTIKSRCQAFTERLVDPRRALAWLIAEGVEEGEARIALALSGGAPLLALAAARDEEGRTASWFLEKQRELLDTPSKQLAIAGELVRADLESVLGWWARLVHVALRTAAGGEPCLAGVDERLARVPVERLVEFAERVNETREGLRVNLNPALAMDHLTWQLAQLSASID